MFNPGQETQDERTLRERKAALLSLFEAVNLRPHGEAHVQDDGNTQKELDNTAKRLTQHPRGTKQKRTEIVGDCEEVEVEEGEELSDNELDVIYKKWVLLHDVGHNIDKLSERKRTIYQWLRWILQIHLR